MYDPEDPELQTMASGIINAIKRYSITYECMTAQEIWEELQRKGYKFPVSGRRSDTLNLAIKKLKAKPSSKLFLF